MEAGAVSHGPLSLPRHEGRAATDTSTRSATAVAGALVLAFIAAQCLLIFLRLGGPTLDEGIYISAGLRTLEGEGISDGYLTWFPGSLLWPTVAALGDIAGGIDGARMVALACVTTAVVAVAGAAGNLFEPRTRPFAVAVTVTCGPLLALAHLAVYDVLAITGLAVAFWGVSKLAVTDDRRWLVVAAVSFIGAVLGKYPALVFGGVPIVALIFALRGPRARMDAAIFTFVAGAGLLVYYLVARGQLSSFVTERPGQNPDFGITFEMVGYGLVYYSAITALLALAGALAVGKSRAGLTAALLAGLLLPAAYHLGVAGSIGDHKHVVYGFVFAFPLAGLALQRAWDAGRFAPAAIAPAIVALGAFGALQMDRIDRGSPDLSSSISYLASEVRPGDRMLINTSWPYTYELYSQGKIESPDAVYDVYRIAHGQNPVALCDFDWFVQAPGGSSWPRGVSREISDCGTFERVYTKPAEITGLRSDLRFVEYTAPATVWRNTGR